MHRQTASGSRIIVLATGGSGGHLFPAIKTAGALKNQGFECLFMGFFGAGKAKIQSAGFDYVEFSLQGIGSKNIVHILRAVILSVKAFFSTLNKLKNIQPSAVAGFGGYASFPVVLAAALLRIPTMIHEQNVIPGKANRWLNQIVLRRAVSFVETKRFLNSSDVVVTGCPTHLESAEIDVKKCLDEFGFSDKKFTVLVFGGSQGSRKINEVFLDALRQIPAAKEFQIIHLTGQKDLDTAQQAYVAYPMKRFVASFSHQMAKAYTVSHLVIARAGASTITEIAMFRKPSILIPYPHAHGHQVHNAHVLSERNLAVAIEEKNLTAEKLAEAIQSEYLRWKDNLRLDAARFNDVFIPQAEGHLAKEIIQLAQR